MDYYAGNREDASARAVHYREVALRHIKYMLRCLQAAQAGKVTSNTALGTSLIQAWVN